MEKGDVGSIAQQIEDLNNIIQYENANIMNFYSAQQQVKPECPDDILVKEENIEDQQPLNLEEFRKLALEVFL